MLVICRHTLPDSRHYKTAVAWLQRAPCLAMQGHSLGGSLATLLKIMYLLRGVMPAVAASPTCESAFSCSALHRSASLDMSPADVGLRTARGQSDGCCTLLKQLTGVLVGTRRYVWRASCLL